MSTLALYIGYTVLIAGGIALATALVWGSLYAGASYAAKRKRILMDFYAFLVERRQQERAAVLMERRRREAEREDSA